jgi:endoglucanase
MKKQITILPALLLVLALLLNGCSPVIPEDKKTETTPAATQQKEQSTQEAAAPALPLTETIHINQVGYRPDDKKSAIFIESGGKFEIVNEKNGETVLRGEAGGPVNDKVSGDLVWYADFSSLKKPGNYFLQVPEVGRSHTFAIDENSYGEVRNALLKAFYYQRCGMELEGKYAGLWVHKACHLQDGLIFPSEKERRDGDGGWHDAGDYGKYTVPGAVAAAHLLLAYEFFPNAFKTDINIPESGNGTPDILNECRYELEWLLKIQEEKSGGVYHKLASRGFPDFILPETDLTDLYFTPVSSTATGDFSAVMAMAARVYAKLDPDFSKRCKKASEKAWNWLQKHQELIGTKNPEGITTGEYGDYVDSDERFWAAAELYRLTGDKQYHELVKEGIRPGDPAFLTLGWQSVGGFGVLSYLFGDKGKTDSKVYDAMKQDWLQAARDKVKTAAADGYGMTLSQREYGWGSNMTVMNNAMLLLVANRLETNENFVQTALDQFHYLLGRNAMGVSYVTGFGEKSVMKPHHRPSGADRVKEPVPGLVSGGPNRNLEDGAAQSQLQGQPPAKCFIDDVGSYSTNEIAIYWNSPAVFVAAALSQEK